MLFGPIWASAAPCQPPASTMLPPGWPYLDDKFGMWHGLQSFLKPPANIRGAPSWPVATNSWPQMGHGAWAADGPWWPQMGHGACFACNKQCSTQIREPAWPQTVHGACFACNKQCSTQIREPAWHLDSAQHRVDAPAQRQ